MSEFNKAVDIARKKYDPSKSIADQKPIKNTKPIQYVLLTSGYEQESWPTTFKFTPRKGDLVESNNGRILEISSITHGPHGVVIRLTRNLGGSSGISGGGSGGDPL